MNGVRSALQGGNETRKHRHQKLSVKDPVDLEFPPTFRKAPLTAGDSERVSGIERFLNFEGRHGRSVSEPTVGAVAPLQPAPLTVGAYIAAGTGGYHR